MLGIGSRSRPHTASSPMFISAFNVQITQGCLRLVRHRQFPLTSKGSPVVSATMFLGALVTFTGHLVAGPPCSCHLSAIMAVRSSSPIKPSCVSIYPSGTRGPILPILSIEKLCVQEKH
ncbi:hypothetical protein LZ30DRAFT_690046 [Colletotrichum cereale]|nr:hypothetical protein LZ30DRAFT_690046 [Colletotrichum cereale]